MPKIRTGKTARKQRVLRMSYLKKPALNKREEYYKQLAADVKDAQQIASVRREMGGRLPKGSLTSSRGRGKRIKK